jgi:GPH family glycoside/pentoside/hexuronide:cation symporter
VLRGTNPGSTFVVWKEVRMQTQKLSTLEKVGFGAGDMALNVVISSMMLIITFFYTEVYGLKTTDLALLFVLVMLFGEF